MCIYVNSHATIFTLQMASAPEPTSHYTEDSLQLAIQDVRCSKLSLRMAARQYGILKSRLSLYVSGKLQIGARRGPASILSPEEEQRIVDYAVHTGEIGYGRTREQIFDIVAAIVSNGETSTSSDECNCVVCDTHDDGRWIQCDVCDSWCHFKCANIPDNLSTESLDWQCVC